MWQLVRLNENYDEAFHQVSKALEYWSPFSRSSFHADQFIAGLNFFVHKNKQRLTKITQYLIRGRNLAKNTK